MFNNFHLHSDITFEDASHSDHILSIYIHTDPQNFIPIDWDVDESARFRNANESNHLSNLLIADIQNVRHVGTIKWKDKNRTQHIPWRCGEVEKGD